MKLTRYKKKVIRHNSLTLAKESINIILTTALTANYLFYLSIGWTGCFFTDLFKTDCVHILSVALFLMVLILIPCVYLRWMTTSFSRKALISSTQRMGIFLDCLRLFLFAVAVLIGWLLAYLVFPYPITTFVMTVFLIHVVGLITLYGFGSIIRQLVRFQLMK